MSYPELYSDERVVLQAQNVKVKSVVFEVVLTTRRLVLIDSKKGSIPPQEINLATLKDVEGGENAIRDPTITISIITISGNTRQMVLTFSKTSGGERRREAEEWIRALRQNVTSTVYHPVTQTPAPKETAPAPAVRPPVQQPAAAQPPAAAPPRIEVTNPPPPKKRIEIARPMKKIVEAAPAMPAPVETTSLPTGSFCNRCGNRVPPDSAFCNRCGTPVVRDTDASGIPQEEPAVTWEEYTPPAAAVPQVQVNPSPVFPTISEKKERPIEQVIHSIEPLIEDSVPRTGPAPIVPQKQVYPVHPAEVPPPADQEPAAPPAGPAPAAANTGAPAGEVKWPVLSPSATPLATTPETPASPPAAPQSSGSVPPTPALGKISVRLLAVIAVVILAILGGAYVLFMQPGGTPPPVTPTPTVPITETGTPARTTVPAVTTTVKQPTPVQQASPAPLPVPPNGVFVKITTTGKFSGSVGTPGRMQDVVDTKNLYQISTSTGPVAVSLQKSEGTSALFSVDVYKDGVLVKHAETTAPKGRIEFEAVLIPATTATPAATASATAP
ncbi:MULTISPECIES: zinc-ribbon domain-containing protein [unclassified Methanoregula]|uniref:zinc-ribbon domain-containing protein n=1 Tax=unclassified Methanoregula TaxID=2649730 RepID=UPI0009C4E124|nr:MULTISPECIES: zinc-ribbon domain-containing protein [unclassified Methanoregula]OPX63041.1 MAG: hypothetical protein A4E33_01911 [Methanoregula sp. PtaB.Bin085]OPY32316.1 MAG: hypothetical protein A4E34_02691 [Methanoregula sp. PtaU1.Bin006]